MNLRLERLFSLALACAALAACEDIETRVIIDAEEIDDPCLADRFPWRARLATLTLTESNVALMRFEASEGPATFDDSIAFSIAQGSALTDEGSGVVPVAPAHERERAQGTMVLPHTCPDDDSAMWIFDGELVFDRVVAEAGEEVSGRFVGTILDGHRLERVAARGVTVEFRFPFKSWRPFQVFSPTP